MNKKLIPSLAPSLILLASLGFAIENLARSKNQIWVPIDQSARRIEFSKPMFRPKSYVLYDFDTAAFQNDVWDVKSDDQRRFIEPDLEIELPQPTGKFAKFKIVESPVMEAGLAAIYPDIKSYRGIGITDPSATVRLSLSPKGCQAQILSPNGAYYIDPYYQDNAKEHVCVGGTVIV